MYVSGTRWTDPILSRESNVMEVDMVPRCFNHSDSMMVTLSCTSKPSRPKYDIMIIFVVVAWLETMVPQYTEVHLELILVR